MNADASFELPADGEVMETDASAAQGFDCAVWYREYTDNCSFGTAVRLLHQAENALKIAGQDMGRVPQATQAAIAGFHAGACLTGALLGRRGTYPVIDAGLLADIDPSAARDLASLEKLYCAIWRDGVVPSTEDGEEGQRRAARLVGKARRIIHRIQVEHP